MYECWVYYRILYGAISRFNVQFRQTSRSDGTVSFESTDGKIVITYQKWVATGWVDRNTGPIQDRPDVVFEMEKLKAIVVDAKNR